MHSRSSPRHSAPALWSASLAVQRFTGRHGNQCSRAVGYAAEGGPKWGLHPGACVSDHVGSGPAAESGAAAARTGGGTVYGDRAACCRYRARAFRAPLPALTTPPGTPTLGNAPHTRLPRPVAANSWFRAPGGPSAAVASVPGLIFAPRLSHARRLGTALYSVPLYPFFPRRWV